VADAGDHAGLLFPQIFGNGFRRSLLPGVVITLPVATVTLQASQKPEAIHQRRTCQRGRTSRQSGKAADEFTGNF